DAHPARACMVLSKTPRLGIRTGVAEAAIDDGDRAAQSGGKAGDAEGGRAECLRFPGGLAGEIYARVAFDGKKAAFHIIVQPRRWPGFEGAASAIGLLGVLQGLVGVAPPRRAVGQT